MTLDEETKILGELRDGLRAAEFGLAFRWYFILNSNIPLIIYFNA
jgi:hypothetical protein